MKRGIGIGHQVGELQFAEHIWHCIGAAIEAMESGNDLRALGILRTSQYMTAHATGRNITQEKTDAKEATRGAA